MTHVAGACEQFGLKLNTFKTKYVIISKSNIVQDNGIQVIGTHLERCQKQHI